MTLIRLPHAIALDQVAQPLAAKYAFECVEDRGDLARNTVDNPIEVHLRMSDILKELGEAVVADSLETRYWHPARLVRGVMDHALRDESYLPLLFDATRVAIEMYARPRGCTSLAPFAKDIEHRKLGDVVVYQKSDPFTMRAERPVRAERAASRIATDLRSPALFLANCNGGLIPAIQTALMHERQFPGNRLIPVRFSIRKQNQQSPELMSQELRLITEESEDLPIIVYDDDADTGDTLKGLVRYLSASLPSGRDISAYVSFDMRGPSTKSMQGERWEHRVTESRSEAHTSSSSGS